MEVFEALTAKELTEIVRRTLEEANSPQDRINDGVCACEFGDIVDRERERKRERETGRFNKCEFQF